jgi:hypothetical protein
MSDALKKRRASSDDRANPLSRFRDYTVYRLAPDMFVSVAGRFCVIASSLPLLRESLDLAAQQGSASLASDPLFGDFSRRGMPDSEISIFIRKERVEKMNGILRGIFGDDRPVSADTGIGHSSDKTSSTGEIRPVYAGAGIRMSGSSLHISLITSLDESDPIARLLLGMFSVPERQECAFSDNYLFFMHLYCNAGPLSRACAEERHASSTPCSAAEGLRSILENYTEIEIDDDLIGSHAGFIDMLMRKSADADLPDETLLYLPLKDADDADRLWKKLRDRCRQKYRDDDAFGRDRILDKPLFWIKDQNDSRTYYAARENALFVGNSMPLMEKVMRDRNREFSEVCGLATGSGMAEGTFALASIDLAHSRVMKAFLQLSAYKVNLMLYSLLDVTDTFIFTGHRDGSAFVLDFKLTLNPGAAPGPASRGTPPLNDINSARRRDMLRKTALTLLFALAAALPAPAAQNAPITEAGKYLDDNVVTAKLRNGVKVTLLDRGYAPTLAMIISFRVGSADESYQTAGMAHLLEHMLFKGTDKIGTTDYAAEKKAP